MSQVKKENLKIHLEVLKSLSDSRLLEFQQIIIDGRGHDKPYVPFTKKEISSEIKRRNLNKK